MALDLVDGRAGVLLEFVEPRVADAETKMDVETPRAGVPNEIVVHVVDRAQRKERRLDSTDRRIQVVDVLGAETVADQCRIVLDRDAEGRRHSQEACEERLREDERIEPI